MHSASTISPTASKRAYVRHLLMAMPLFSLLLFVLNAINMTLPLFFGLITREFFDVLSGVKGSGWDAGINIWWLVILFFLNRVLVQMSEILAAGSSALYYYVIEAMLRRNIFRALMEAVGFPIPVSSGEVANRLDEDTDAIAAPLFVITYGSGAVVSAIVTVWVMARIHLPLTIVALLPTVLSVLIVNWMGPRLERFHMQARNASEDVVGLLTTLLDGVQAVKVAGAEEAVTVHFDTLGRVRQSAMVRDDVLNTLVHSLNETTIRLTTGLLLIFAAGLLQDDTLTVGDLALFIAYVSVGGGLSELVEIISRAMRNLKKANVSLDRIFELVPLSDRPKLVSTEPIRLRTENAPFDGIASVRNENEALETLMVTNLAYRHVGSERGISDISFSLKRGELVAIVGQIGSGKSLLLQTLLGLHHAQNGEIRWNGRVVKKPAAFFVPPRCAYVPQTPRLFSDSLRDNILMGIRAEDVALQSAIEAAVLESDILQLEDGLDTVVGPRGVKLSGGQIQRAAAARMFLRQAELLVVDDLSSALDVETERILWERFFVQPNENGKVARPACLVVSHRPVVLQQADRILLLDQGRMVDSGPLNALLERSTEMRSLWGGFVKKE